MLLNENVDSTYLELEELHIKYSDLFNYIPVGVFILDHAGIIQKANQAAANIIGVEFNSFIHKSFSRYIAPNFQPEFTQFRKRLTKKMDVQTCEIKFLQRHQPLFYAQLTGKASINFKTGDIELLVMVSVITNRYQDDESHDNPQVNLTKLTESSVNLMVNNLNQPISIIANYIYGCINRIEKGDYDSHHLLQAMKQAEQELHRTAEIIMRMKNFSCKEIFKYEKLCLNSIIEEIISIINYEIIRYPVTIRYRPTRGLPMIRLDRIYIQQAILNLARNAIEAMQEAEMSDPKLIIEINQPSKNILEISLTDNGPAFYPDTVHKLFETSFTTKSYGTGLGLIISRIIVESHNGKLLVELNPTRGARFTIALPLDPLARYE